MSADKDRGIRRKKQKRAKQNQKVARERRVPDTAKAPELTAKTAE